MATETNQVLGTIRGLVEGTDYEVLSREESRNLAAEVGIPASQRRIVRMLRSEVVTAEFMSAVANPRQVVNGLASEFRGQVGGACTFTPGRVERDGAEVNFVPTGSPVDARSNGEMIDGRWVVDRTARPVRAAFSPAGSLNQFLDADRVASEELFYLVERDEWRVLRDWDLRTEIIGVAALVSLSDELDAREEAREEKILRRKVREVEALELARKKAALSEEEEAELAEL